MFLKISFVAISVSIVIFLKFIYPNIKKPKWERKIISAKYLRDRKYFELADEVLEKTIAQFPGIRQLYIAYFYNYSGFDNMEKLFNTVLKGYEKSGAPAAGAILAWCYIEEGEFEKAEKLLEEEDITDFCIENNMPLKSRCFFKKGEYEKADKEFENFYKKLFPEAENDEDLYSELHPEELIMLVVSRRKTNKSWKVTARIIPVESLHEEGCWKTYFKNISEKKESFDVKAGIHGSPEKVYNYRIKEINDIIETLEDYLSDK